MRLIVCLLLLAATLGSTALAQMAAPALVPITAGVTDALFSRTPSIVPVNPAVMSWRNYSVGGGGVARAQAIFKGDNGQGFTVELEDTYGGAQWNWGKYAFGIQNFHETSSSPSFRFENSGAILAASMQLGSAFVLGGAFYGDEHTEVSEGSQKTEVNGLSVGASGKFFESFYVGLVGGSESVKRTEEGDPQNNWNGSRTASGLGVGFLNEGPWRLHVEASLYQQGDVGNVAKSTNAQVVTADKTQTVTVEGARGVWVVGLNLSQREQNNTIGPIKLDFTMSNREFSVGVVPEKGMAILFHYGSGDLDAVQSGFKTKVITTSRALSAVWIF